MHLLEYLSAAVEFFNILIIFSSPFLVIYLVVSQYRTY